MADMRVSDDQVQGAAQKINVTMHVAEDALTSLRSQIHAFLGQGDDPHRPQASPALQRAYDVYHTQLDQMINSLQYLSGHFQQITHALDRLDQDFARRINDGLYG